MQSNNQESNQDPLLCKEMYGAASISAAVYDLQTSALSSQCNGDIDFYRQHAAVGMRVLELGVGTGRVAWNLAAFGCEVTGIDTSETMLALAADKASGYHSQTVERLTLHHQSMSDFHFPQMYELVLSPFRGFNQLTDRDQARRCLELVRRHLSPHGRAILHLMGFPEDCLARLGEPPGDEPHDFIFPDGAILSATFTKRTIDFYQQILSLEIEYSYRDVNRTLLRRSRERWNMTWFGWKEFEYLAEMSGFKVCAAYSDFLQTHPRSGGEQIWVLEPAG